MGSPTPPARGARLIGCRDREKGGREGGAGRLGAPRPPPLQESGPRRAPPPRRPPLEQRPEAPRAPDVPGRGRPAAGAWGPQRPGRGAPRSRARSPAAPAARALAQLLGTSRAPGTRARGPALCPRPGRPGVAAPRRCPRASAESLALPGPRAQDGQTPAAPPAARAATPGRRVPRPRGVFTRRRGRRGREKRSSPFCATLRSRGGWASDPHRRTPPSSRGLPLF